MREHQQLAEFDSDIERQKRRQHMGTRKLQGLPECEGETKAMHQPEAESDYPARVDGGSADDVLSAI